MCEPGTLGILSAIGTVAKAGAQIFQGQQEGEAGRSRARLLAMEAEKRRVSAATEAEDFRKRQRRLLAKQRAGFAASGVTMEGTPILVGGDTAQEIELQAQRLLVAGLTDATLLEFRSDIEERQARSAQFGGVLKAGSTLLTGFGRGEFGKSGKKIPSSVDISSIPTGPGWSVPL